MRSFFVQYINPRKPERNRRAVLFLEVVRAKGKKGKGSKEEGGLFGERF
jgi:hypothetical protein